jgi:glycosyltransferase involved in cell wall biosynthesis
MRIVFWHNMLSPHQSSLTRALADSGSDVLVVASEQLSAERLAMGWSVPDFGRAKLLIGPSAGDVKAVILERLLDSVHIVGGARWTPLGRAATANCIRLKARLGIMSETADSRGLKGAGRWVRYTIDRLVAGRHFDFVLAIGQTGVRWFRACGYQPGRVFPFGYFTEDPLAAGGHTQTSAGPGVPALMYLGRCVPGKGLDTLFSALALCTELEWKLTLLGDGSVKPALERLARLSRLRSRIEFLPFAENQSAMRRLSGMDLLILPSNGKEGWGAVVNEGLMLGVPVLCSSRCGAADLLGEEFRGEVFRAGSTTELARALRKWIIKGKRAPSERESIRGWSRCIEGESGARYLKAILGHIYEGKERPVAPWHSFGPALAKET